MNKRGYFFMIDTIIGVTILVSAVLYFYNIHYYEQPKNQLYLLSDNMINFLSTNKIATLNNPMIDKMRLNGNITNIDNTLLEQVNEFEYRTKNGCNYCRNLSEVLVKNVTDGIVEAQYNFRLVLNNTLIYEKSRFPDSAALTTLKVGRVVYTIINQTILYGPSYAEITIWQ